MVAWLKLPHSKTSSREVFLETCTTKTLEVPSVWSYKAGFKNKDISLPTKYHPFQLKHLSQVLTLSQHLWSPHTPPNPALTQSTSNLIRDTHFDKSNFICPVGSSPNLYHSCTFLLSRTSWPSIPCSTHSPFALQTLGIPNHVVYLTNSGYTKPRARILAPGPLHVPNHVHTLDQSTLTSFHKRTTWHLTWLNHTIL